MVHLRCDNSFVVNDFEEAFGYLYFWEGVVSLHIQHYSIFLYCGIIINSDKYINLLTHNRNDKH